MKDNSKSPQKSKARSKILNIIFSLIVFLVFILILEIVFRTTHPFNARLSWLKPDPILEYRFVPGSKHWDNRENDHPITGKINSYGWRDKEWSLQKPSNVFRIAVLGDSYVVAFQVELDSTFLKLTERQLNQNSNLKVELMNFGRGSASQTEELLILKSDVTQFSPDMVLLFFHSRNDIKDISKETATSLRRPFYSISESGKLILDTSFREKTYYKIRLFTNYFQRNSALLTFIGERYTAYERDKRKRALKITGEMLPEEMVGYLSLCTNHPDATYLKNYRLNKILLKTMAEYCKEKGVEFMLVCLDIPTYIPEIEKEYKAIDSTFDTNFFEDDLRSYAESLNFEYLGLQRVFTQFYENTGVTLHWGHWNYQGHKVVANALANKLKSTLTEINKENNK